MIQNWKFQRGDIFFTRFDNAIGSEQSGNRPAVVLQNDVGNFYSPTLIVATLTSKAAKKYTQPTHCRLCGRPFTVNRKQGVKRGVFSKIFFEFFSSSLNGFSYSGAISVLNTGNLCDAHTLSQHQNSLTLVFT